MSFKEKPFWLQGLIVGLILGIIISSIIIAFFYIISLPEFRPTGVPITQILVIGLATIIPSLVLGIIFGISAKFFGWSFWKGIGCITLSLFISSIIAFISPALLWWIVLRFPFLFAIIPLTSFISINIIFYILSKSKITKRTILIGSIIIVITATIYIFNFASKAY